MAATYKVTLVDETLNKVHVILTYQPKGEAFAKSLGHYFETDDFSLENIQKLSVEALQKFIEDIDASLKPMKDSGVPPETKAIIGKEYDLEGKQVNIEEAVEPAPK